jgi:pyruvate/2-oxoglutarate dehydrogenase complex dihydrolipoamide acyltransferase (E2) component
MENKEKVIKVTTKSGKDLIQRMQSRKVTIESYFKGDITIDELNAKGIKFVRTI